jgi:colicin import membrane protein
MWLAGMTFVADSATAGDKTRCCDPCAVPVQSPCAGGTTMLPYHFALERAAAADKAEKALSETTKQRDAGQAELARLREELAAAVAGRDAARKEAVAAQSEARKQAAEATSQRQAAEAARKAKADADAALAVAKDQAAKQLAAAQADTRKATDEARKLATERDQFKADMDNLKKSLADAELKVQQAEQTLKDNEGKSKKPTDEDAPKKDAVLPDKTGKAEDEVKPKSEE